MSGLTKRSFHESGIYRYAVKSQTPREAIQSWRRPPQSTLGVTSIFAIAVPPIRAPKNFADKLPSSNKPTILIPAPKIDSNAGFRILLAEPHVSEAEILKLPSGVPLSCHGHVRLKRETAWLISSYSHFDLKQISFITKLIATTKINLRAGRRKEDVASAFLHAFDFDKKAAPIYGPVLIDVWLGRDNLYIDEK